MDPWARVLQWRAWEMDALQTLAECRSCPSEYGHLMDIASRDAEYFRAARIRDLERIKTELVCRRMDRDAERIAAGLYKNDASLATHEAA
jgi:hypothetical protein